MSTPGVSDIDVGTIVKKIMGKSKGNKALICHIDLLKKPGCNNGKYGGQKRKQLRIRSRRSKKYRLGEIGIMEMDVSKK